MLLFIKSTAALGRVLDLALQQQVVVVASLVVVVVVGSLGCFSSSRVGLAGAIQRWFFPLGEYESVAAEGSM